MLKRAAKPPEREAKRGEGGGGWKAACRRHVAHSITSQTKSHKGSSHIAVSPTALRPSSLPKKTLGGGSGKNTCEEKGKCETVSRGKYRMEKRERFVRASKMSFRAADVM